MILQSGPNWDLVYQMLARWVTSASGLDDQHVYWVGQADAPRTDETSIAMKLSLADDGQPWVDILNNPLVFSDISVDAITGSTLNAPGHGLVTGDGSVALASTSTLPSPITAGQRLWVIAPDVDHFQFATTFENSLAGTAITLTDAGTGVMTVSSTPQSLRAGQEQVNVSRTLINMTLSLTCYAATALGARAPLSILQRVSSRGVLNSNRAFLVAANIGLLDVGKVRTVRGTKNAIQFEPRAVVDVTLNMPDEEGEYGTIINRTLVTDQLSGRVLDIRGSD